MRESTPPPIRLTCHRPCIKKGNSKKDCPPDCKEGMIILESQIAFSGEFENRKK